MTTRALVEELVGAWQTNDALRASAFFAINGVYAESGRAPIEGRAAILEHFQRFFRDGPAWRIEVDEIVAEDDRAAVAYRFSIKGRTGNWRERAGCALVRREDGLIALWREYHG
ncbi:MAG: nuclear transport factor 2 family protein [Vulcanimicrobiaceae bacterium]